MRPTELDELPYDVDKYYNVESPPQPLSPSIKFIILPLDDSKIKVLNKTNKTKQSTENTTF